MSDLNKYRGVIPAFYACYDDEGNISPERVRGLTRYLIGKGVNGLYVGGSSGECIYQGVEERKVVLENVMAEAKGKVVIIAHVACNNTADSRELAAHAESLGVDVEFQEITWDYKVEELNSRAIDCVWNGMTLTEDVLAAMEEKGYTFVQAAVEMVPQNYVKLENEDDIKNMEKLIDLLEENDDVQNVWHNWDND